ncbi:MAG: hypothetical protein PW792_07440 [Acidobacteriaceae bacterium]|nr:hypothetical protein [Acidobacteriaceae bacterium]
MRKLIAITALFAAAALPLGAQTHPTHHAGDWWRNHNDDYHFAYLSGYKSALHHQIGHDTPLTPFSAYAVRAGVNKFYNDFRNRNIVIDDAIIYVGKQLSGASKHDLDQELLGMRANAAKLAPEGDGSDD